MDVVAGHNFAKMTREELLAYCRGLYAEKGVAAFSYPALKSIPKLYSTLYSAGLSQKAVLAELGIADEYKRHLLSKPFKYGATVRERWTWEGLVQKALAIKEAEGRLPPALWFSKNGHAAFIQALYNLGHTWAELREAVGDFTGSNFVQSRNGLRWLSHAEASLSNFLYARGIEHKKGERYDDSFANLDVTRYAIYDLHVRGANGQWIDVEVWGDKPHGHNEEKYARTRAAKEAFNSGNPNFLGIHHADCYDEERLTEILRPHVGETAPFKFDKATDRLIHSTHWSNADELLEFCKELASTMPNGKFPAEDWLRKRGRWTDREGAAYNTLAVYIKQWLGGIRKLRQLIGQEHASTQQWDRESALAAHKAFYDKHGVTPNQVRHGHYRKANSAIPRNDARKAARIASAVEKYAGGADVANELLGISVERQASKWPKQVLLDAIKRIALEHGLSPNQLLYDHRKGRIELPHDKVTWVKRVVDAVARFPGGLPAAFQELGMEPPKRQ